MLQCSATTREALHRARALVDVIEPSNLTAFAILQLELGRDLGELRTELDPNADQLASIRQRLREPEPQTKPKSRKRGRPRRG